MARSDAASDRQVLVRWVEEASARGEFWTSRPAWGDLVGFRQVEGRLLVCTPAGILDVAPAPAVVAAHIDGESTLAELAEDLAAAAGMDLADVQPMVASLAVELQAWGAVEGVELTEPPRPPQPVEDGGDRQYLVVDPDSGEQMRVEEVVDVHGNRSVTEHLPDGRRRITSYLTYVTGEDDLAMADAEDLAAAVLTDRRSAAELLPPDSCIGSKLRNDETVDLVSIRCQDDKVRSVRCHDAAVARALVDRAGDLLASDGERGPIEAFVVTPLEGDGPLRIYDGRGRRRGRPRGVPAAVEVIDQLLGEATARRASGLDAPIVLNASLATRGSRSLLIDPPLLDRWVDRKRMVSDDWMIADGRALAVSGGRVALPSAMGEGLAVSIR